MSTRTRIALAAVMLVSAAGIQADEVTDWNWNMQHALVVAGTSPIVATRVGALVQVAVFDALNGIDHQYTPIHVAADAPRHTSRCAAVASAAHTILVDLFSSQATDFDTELAASLAALADAGEDDDAILRGVAWGKAVADEIWAWRSTDGITPNPPAFTGGSDPGEWRPTPAAYASGAVPQFATMTPWAIECPSQFRPDGPPALDSKRYAEVFNEIKTMGSASSTLRTADQTLFAKFWNSATVTYFWNTVAMQLSNERGYSLSDNAHLLALLNIALADAAISCWDAKYHYVFWRPVTAVPLADTDGNPDTEADPLWAPLLGTPAHPEYSSGHSTTSSGAATVLVHFFGQRTCFTVDSYAMPGVTRSFASFSDALDEIADARVYGGIHFRTACEDGRAEGHKVGRYVLKHAALAVHGHGHDCDDDDNSGDQGNHKDQGKHKGHD